jgi:hypothetical protein
LDKQYAVYVSRFAEKQIAKLPNYIREFLYAWKETIELEGISRIRAIPVQAITMNPCTENAQDLVRLA